MNISSEKNRPYESKKSSDDELIATAIKINGKKITSILIFPWRWILDPLGRVSQTWKLFANTLHLSEDVVRCIGAGERYVYRRNPGWTQITFTNLKRPSSKLHKVKGWFSSKGFFQLFYFGKKLQVLPESIFYYWFSTLCFCTFACYSKIFFNLNLPDFFLIKTKAAEVIFWPQG